MSLKLHLLQRKVGSNPDVHQPGNRAQTVVFCRVEYHAAAQESNLRLMLRAESIRRERQNYTLFSDARTHAVKE